MCSFGYSLINTSIVNKLKNNDRTNKTIIMVAIVHSIYSQSVHAPALDAGLMDNDAERYCMYPPPRLARAPLEIW